MKSKNTKQVEKMWTEQDEEMLSYCGDYLDEKQIEWLESIKQRLLTPMRVKEIIELTLREVREQGFDLIDEYTNGDTEKAVEMVYDAIKDEL